MKKIRKNHLNALIIALLLATNNYMQASLVGTLKNINPYQMSWGKNGIFAIAKTNNDHLKIFAIIDNKIKEVNQPIKIISDDFRYFQFSPNGNYIQYTLGIDRADYEIIYLNDFSNNKIGKKIKNFTYDPNEKYAEFDWHPNNKNFAINNYETKEAICTYTIKNKKIRLAKTIPITYYSDRRMYNLQYMKKSGKYIYYEGILDDEDIDEKEILLIKNLYGISEEDSNHIGQIIKINSKQPISIKINNKDYKFIGFPRDQILFHPTEDSFIIYTSGENNETILRSFKIIKDEIILDKKFTYKMPITPKCFSYNGKYIAFTRPNKNTIGFINFKSGKILKKYIKGHKSPIKTIKFSRDGKYIASISKDGELKIWNNPFYKEPIRKKDFEERIKFALEEESK